MDYIYGSLNQNLISIDYSGVENEEAKVLVDNINRLIEVIVKKLPNTLIILDQDGSAIKFDGSSIKEIDLTTASYQEALDILRNI